MTDASVEFEVLNVESYYFKLDSSNVDVFMAKQGFELLIKSMGFSVVSAITVDRFYDISDDYDYTLLEAYIVKRPDVNYKIQKGDSLITIKIPKK